MSSATTRFAPPSDQDVTRLVREYPFAWLVTMSPLDFAATPRTLILFMGPHGYISSSWLGDRTRTPTWNYAMVQYLVDIEFMESPDETNALIAEQVDTMELGRPNAWSVPEMGSRYERLVSGIVGFRAHIRERRVKFKLGQDERDAEYADITAALSAGGPEGSTLLEWMHRSNRNRAG